MKAEVARGDDETIEIPRNEAKEDAKMEVAEDAADKAKDEAERAGGPQAWEAGGGDGRGEGPGGKLSQAGSGQGRYERACQEALCGQEGGAYRGRGQHPHRLRIPGYDGRRAGGGCRDRCRF